MSGFLTPSTRLLLALCVCLCASLWACGDDGGGSDPEADLPRSNGLFTYNPGEEGAAPGYYVEVDVDGQPDTLTSNEAELRLITEGQYRRQREASVSGDAASLDTTRDFDVEFGADRRSKSANQLPGAVASLRRPEISFGVHAARPTQTFNFERLLAGLDNQVPLRANTIGSQQLRDDDGDGVPEDPDLSKCTGGVNTGCSDNCPFVENSDQADEDLDRIGDACQGDPDGDGVLNDGDDSGTDGDSPCESVNVESCDDNCPNVANRRQWDVDGDGIGDACDTDRDGNGIADLDEGTIDHDNDGVPTADEGDVDSDGDGSPDYLDPDDDGDGIPSRNENDDDGTFDPDRDSDDDGIPDSRDPDSDNDGIDDENEGNRDTDGDGTPDFQDDDDDGDGTPTSEEYDGDDQDTDGDGTPNHLDDNPNDGCAERKTGKIYSTIPTFGGWTTWNAISFTVTTPVGPCTVTDAFSVCPDNDYTWAIHLATDGIYFSLQRGQGFSFPPDLYGIGITESVGWMMSPDGDGSTISGNTMSNGRNLSVSTEFFGRSVGFTILETPDIGFGVPAKFVQLDVGILSLSFGLLDLFGFSFFPSVSLAFSDGGITIDGPDGPGFQLISGWGGSCPGAVGGPSAAELTDRISKQTGSVQTSPAISQLSRSVAVAANSSPTSVNDSYRVELGQSVMPLTTMLSSGSGYGSAQNVPAPTMADWMNEFTNSQGTEVCDNCVNMSIDGIVSRTGEATAASEGSAGRLASLAREQAGQFGAAWPERERAGNLMNLAVGGSINAGTELAYSVAAIRRGDPNRYVSSQIVDIPVTINTSESFTVTAQEIADLVGYSAADIEGATVCVENNPKIDPVCGTIESGELTGSITPSSPEPYILPVDVDLSTAAGRFDDADVGAWTVRPAVRRFLVESAPPTQVALTFPGTIKSGAPATLNANLVDGDGGLSRVDAEYRFYNGAGDLLDTVTTDNGAATFQVQPQPQTPVISAVDTQTVGTSAGDVPGYVIRGSFLSRDSSILIDGRDVEDIGYLYTVADSRGIGIAVVDGTSELSNGSHEFVVISPGGARSNTFSATIP